MVFHTLETLCKDFIETVFLSIGGQEIVGNDWIKFSKALYRARVLA